VAWIVLVISAVLEAVWANALGQSDGFHHIAPTAVFVVTFAASVYGLAVAVRQRWWDSSWPHPPRRATHQNIERPVPTKGTACASPTTSRVPLAPRNLRFTSDVRVEARLEHAEDEPRSGACTGGASVAVRDVAAKRYGIAGTQLRGGVPHSYIDLP
jgi:hypothetical protein